MSAANNEPSPDHRPQAISLLVQRKHLNTRGMGCGQWTADHCSWKHPGPAKALLTTDNCQLTSRSGYY